ncbi:hypothetical protein HZA57_10165 [Candidatus Poribacteria bacterium]|nr:hypothetical protein [Candidatus Poribacteria bacterium]
MPFISDIELMNPDWYERSFFHGLTEEVRKRSVPNSHTATAFEFTTKEDGEDVSDWTTGAATTKSVSSDTARRSNVMHLYTSGPSGYWAYAGRYNTSGTSWNITKRMLSMWARGAASAIEVSISASGGNAIMKYATGTGTSGYDSGTRMATMYVGDAFSEGNSQTIWKRFERNVEADFEGLGGPAWTDVDGVCIRVGNSNYRVDEIRLSNSMTLEHNTLAPGVIGHIARHRTINSSTYAVTDRYFHYDQVGSVVARGGKAPPNIRRP